MTAQEDRDELRRRSSHTPEGMAHGTEGTAGKLPASELLGKDVKPTGVLEGAPEYDEGRVMGVESWPVVEVKWNVAAVSYLEHVDALDVLGVARTKTERLDHRAEISAVIRALAAGITCAGDELLPTERAIAVGFLDGLADDLGVPRSHVRLEPTNSARDEQQLGRRVAGYCLAKNGPELAEPQGYYESTRRHDETYWERVWDRSDGSITDAARISGTSRRKTREALECLGIRACDGVDVEVLYLLKALIRNENRRLLGRKITLVEVQAMTRAQRLAAADWISAARERAKGGIIFYKAVIPGFLLKEPKS
jgi:hypothetical protein